MQCPRCQHDNEVDAKFCEECAASLARTCGNCGRQLSQTAKFCPTCAHPTDLAATGSTARRFTSPESYTPRYLAERILHSKAALEGERKQVTVLFADLKGSMELLADRDPEEARQLLDPVLERMMEAVHRYEGTVNQVMGDGIMALFGAPIAHEDHAVRACYAALRMQERIKRYAEEAHQAHGVKLQIRVGLNSGGVVVRAIGSDLHMDYTAMGQTTHLAARMEQLANPGSILLTPSTLELVEGFVAVQPLGPVPVKGLTDPIEVYEVTGAGLARTRLQAAARRGLTRFVGRDAELAQFHRAQQLAGSGHGQVVAVVGEAGVGKSRLVHEVIHSHRLHGWRILEGAAVSYGKTTSYLPVIDLLKGYFKIQDRDDWRDIRDKVTDTLRTLDNALQPVLPALLALLDVPVDDARGRRSNRRNAASTPSMRSSDCCYRKRAGNPCW
jgi:class 3 adenylate cyclase